MGIRRRSVLVAAATAPVAASTFPPAASAAPAALLDRFSNGERSAELTSWRFVLVNPTDITDPTGQYANAQDPAFDDSAWRAVPVPHDWSIELDPAATPDASSGTGFFHGGLGWYRTSFTLPSELAGRRISVEFDGVYMDSYVYFNGQLVGNHPYGYTGFSFDLTALARTDGTSANVLAVRVQNQQPSSRWYSGSGIYRPVRLVVTDPIHVTRWGTFVTTPGITPAAATVRVRTTVANSSAAPAQLRIVSTVLDAGGHPVGAASTDTTVTADGFVDTVDIPVPNPTLWSTTNPYLYSLRTELVVGGTVVDRYLTTFGIRSFRFDPDEGFSLNGTHMKLYGVDLHHDQGALGAATNRDALVRQMSIMKSMGVNALRTSHNPPSLELIHVCQRLGILMMVEAFDCWQRGKNRFDYGRFFVANSDADIREMVHAAKNSPAVVLWSIGNEIPDSTSTAGLGMAQGLIDGIRSIDTTRPIVIGSDRYRGLPAVGSAADLMLAKLDGLGLNYNTAASVDALHSRYPNLFLFESESSSETSTRGVYAEPQHLNTGENQVPGKRGTSSYDNNLASWTMSGEYGLKKDRDRKFFAGQFLWSGTDYIGEPTPYNVFPVKASFFGAVDTAGFAKDAYYLFASQWTTDPMVHLLPMNWTDHEPGEPVEVWAYSNVDTVELFLNGQSLGTRSFDRKTTTYGREYLETTEATHDDKTVTGGPYPGSYTSPNGSAGKLHLTWNVPFAAGTLVAVARRAGVEVARDQLTTAGPAAALRLVPETRVFAADGRSLCYLRVEVVDRNGVLVPSADNVVGFAVDGGMLVGVDSGRQESAENYQASQRAAWAGRLLAIVRSGTRAGPVTVTATAAGLLPAVATVHAVDSTVDRSSRQLVSLDPLYPRVPLGEFVRLPAAVPAVYADGSQRPVAVSWNPPPAQARQRTGVYLVEGTVRQTQLRARAVVTVFAPSNVETYSTAVPVGVAPGLPATVRLVHSDGVDELVAVGWEAVTPASYGAPGQFTVTGSVAGTGLRAEAHIRVTDAVTPDANLALATGPAKPTADASYAGSPSTLPAAMLDASPTTGGWSNAFTKAATALLPPFSGARAADWVAVEWANPQRFATIRVYFTTGATRSLPASIQVTVGNGDRLVPVSNLAIGWASASNAATTLTFDPVTTTRVRLSMTSPAPDTGTGSLQIAEIEVVGPAVAYNGTAALTDLRVGGGTVAGFDPATTTYTVTAGDGVPDISATAGGNGRLYVVPPPSVPGTARVVVTAEDGRLQQTYQLRLVGPS